MWVSRLLGSIIYTLNLKKNGCSDEKWTFARNLLLFIWQNANLMGLFFILNTYMFIMILWLYTWYWYYDPHPHPQEMRKCWVCSHIVFLTIYDWHFKLYWFAIVISHQETSILLSVTSHSLFLPIPSKFLYKWIKIIPNFGVLRNNFTVHFRNSLNVYLGSLSDSEVGLRRYLKF